jgi:hypothetical protein
MKRVLLLLLAFVFVGLTSEPSVRATGLDEGELRSIYNDTLWYDPSDGLISCQAGTSPSTTGGSELPTEITTLISQNEPTYKEAAEATDVPWQMLAAVHYREANNDPNRDLQNGDTLGTRVNAAGGRGAESTLLQSAIDAGKFLQSNAKGGQFHKALTADGPNDASLIKDAFYSYNSGPGQASAYDQQARDLGFQVPPNGFEGSPYVMNNFDEKHQNMKIITHDHGGLDGTDTRFGAFAIYTMLGGGSTGGSCSGAAPGDAIQTALNYAWPDYHPANYCQEKASYLSAIKAAAANGEYVGGTCTIGGTWPGVDCGAFVTRVMRDSRADPTYNESNGNTISQQAYLDAHPEKYQKLTNVNGTADLHPGDIAINDVHTYMYVGSQPGFNGNSASASFSSTGESWRAPMASNAYGFGGEFTWYRLISGGQNAAQ